jgi:flagella basal body P-ring formation protein FlgA
LSPSGAALILAVLVLVAIGHPAAAQESPLSITVGGNAAVDGRRIHLSDIAEISGEASLVERSSAITLGSAPRLGTEKTLDRRRIESLLRSNRWLPSAAEISIPDTVVVVRASQDADTETLRELFHDAFAGGDEIVVSRFKIRGSSVFPPGRIVYTPNGNGSRRREGRVRLVVGVEVDGLSCGKLTLSGWVDRFGEVVCLRRSLTRGTRITPGDLVVERRSLVGLSSGYISEKADAVGMCLDRKGGAGDPLTEGMLSRPAVIRRGDRVKIVARNGRMKITAIGIAKGDAPLRGQLRVENIASKKIVVGRVVDGSTVEVLF